VVQVRAGAQDPLVLIVSADGQALDDVLARAQDEAEQRHTSLEVVPAVLAVDPPAPPAEVVVVPDRREHPHRLRRVYREALARELARTPARRDGVTTPTELDDAWHTGVADPPVSEDVVRSWRRSLRPPTTWPPRRASAAP
jgi:hypothetical protein